MALVAHWKSNHSVNNHRKRMEKRHTARFQEDISIRKGKAIGIGTERGDDESLSSLGVMDGEGMNYQAQWEAREWGERKEFSPTYIGPNGAQTKLGHLGRVHLWHI